MDEGLRRLYAGEFNKMSQDWQTDGSCIVTLWKRGDSVVHRFRVVDLYGESERVLESEVIDSTPPEYLIKRLNEAKGVIDNAGNEPSPGDVT